MNTTPPPTCRHCGATERYAKEVTANGGYGPSLLPLGLFSYPRLRLEVCAKCGLAEWFVPERFLDRVKARFTRIS